MTAPTITPEDIEAWVKRTRAEQGLPERITDPATLHKAAIIFVTAMRLEQSINDLTEAAYLVAENLERKAG